MQAWINLAVVCQAQGDEAAARAYGAAAPWRRHSNGSRPACNRRCAKPRRNATSVCRFRVGNEMRAWVPGQAWVFGDTVEHEAWNDGAEARAILMFDLCHPQLSVAEQRAVAAMAAGIDAFSNEEGGFGL